MQAKKVIDDVANQQNASKGPKSPNIKTRKNKRSPKIKIRSKPKQMSAPALNVEPRNKTSHKHEHPENPIYAGLAHDDYETDHQAYIGPWLGGRPNTRRSQLRLSSRLQSRASIKRDLPLKFMSVQLQTDNKIPKLRSLSLIKKHSVVKFKSTPKPVTPQQLQILRRNRTFNIKRLQPQVGNLQPLRVSEVHYFTQRNSSFVRNASNPDIDTSQYRIKLRKNLQSIDMIQPDKPRINDRTPDILDKRKSLQQTRSSMFAESRNRIFDFKRMVPRRGLLRDLRDTQLSPLTKPHLLLHQRRHSDDHSLNTSSVSRNSPQKCDNKQPKFNRILFVQKYRFSKPSV